MADIKNYIIALIVIAVVRWLVPKFGKLVNWMILKIVHLMEKLIIGSKLGQKKKKWTLNILRVFGIKATSTISELVDLAVDTMNDKQSDIKSDVKSEVSDKIEESIDKITNK